MTSTRSSAFVGRTDALERLGQAFARAASGDPRTVWVSGESGIGKSTLVRHFQDIAPPHVAVTGSGEVAEQTLHLGVLDQIWRRLEALTGHSLGPLPPEPFVAGADLLGALGSLDGPTILAIDDLQWLDPGSAQALKFLLRRLGAEPLLILLVGRTETMETLGSGWVQLTRDPEAIEQIRATGLSAADVMELAKQTGQGTMSAVAVKALHAHTRGHPLYTRALLDEYGAEGLGVRQSRLPAPRSLRGVVAARTDAMSAPARRLLSTSAVLGGRVGVDLAGMVAQVTDPVVLLDEIVSADLVEPGSDALSVGQGITMHPLIRAAVLDGLSPPELRALHDAAAQVVGPDEALHHRVSAATGPSPQLVADLVARASAAVGVGLHARAADHLFAAASLANTPADRQQLLLEAVEMLHAAGDFVRAEAHRDAVEACREGPRRAYVLGLLAFSATRLEEAETQLSATVAAATAGDVPADWGVRAAASLCLVRLLLADWQGAVDAADLALTSDLEWERSYGHFAVTGALGQLGRHEDALRRAEAQPPRTELAGATSADVGSADMLAARGLARMLGGDLRAADVDLAEVATRARTGEPMRMREFAIAYLAEVRYRLGRWDDALSLAELAVDMAADMGRAGALVRAHTVAAMVLAGRGRHDDADEHLHAAKTVPGLTESRMAKAMIAIAEVQGCVGREDPASAVAAIKRVTGGWLVPEMATVGGNVWRTTVVEALCAEARFDDAHRALLLTAEQRPWLGVLSLDVARFELMIRAAAGDAEGAITLGEQVLESAAPYTTRTLPFAMLSLSVGRLLVSLGQRRHAVDHLKPAHAVVVALGAQPYAAMVKVALADAGLPAATDGGHALMLTSSERRVADLAAEGLSNQDAADQLYLSRRTVEFHLRNVYAKLGIRSRVELSGVLGSGH